MQKQGIEGNFLPRSFLQAKPMVSQEPDALQVDNTDKRNRGLQQPRGEGANTIKAFLSRRIQNFVTPDGTQTIKLSAINVRQPTSSRNDRISDQRGSHVPRYKPNVER